MSGLTTKRSMFFALAVLLLSTLSLEALKLTLPSFVAAKVWTIFVFLGYGAFLLKTSEPMWNHRLTLAVYALVSCLLALFLPSLPALLVTLFFLTAALRLMTAKYKPLEAFCELLVVVCAAVLTLYVLAKAGLALALWTGFVVLAAAPLARKKTQDEAEHPGFQVSLQRARSTLDTLKQSAL